MSSLELVSVREVQGDLTSQDTQFLTYLQSSLERVKGFGGISKVRAPLTDDSGWVTNVVIMLFAWRVLITYCDGEYDITDPDTGELLACSKVSLKDAWMRLGWFLTPILVVMSEFPVDGLA